MTEEINEFEVELKKIVEELAKLKAIVKDKTTRNLVYALSDILSNTWNGYIKLHTYQENCVFELYEDNTYIGQVEMPCKESIITFKDQLKKKAPKLTLDLLYRLVDNLKFLEENKVLDRIKDIEEKIENLEDP